jgi:hypothetical protein
MAISLKKVIIALSLVICISIVVAVSLVGRRAGRSRPGMGPYSSPCDSPTACEVYEARDPNTEEALIRIVALKWDDGTWFGSIMFKRLDGKVWYVGLDSGDSADLGRYAVFCGYPGPKTRITLTKAVFSPSETEAQGVHVFRWAEIDKLLKRASVPAAQVHGAPE